MADWDGDVLHVGSERFMATMAAAMAWLAAKKRGERPEVAASDPDLLPVSKSRRMIDQLVDHVETHKPSTILELGSFIGGSTALLAELAPDSVVVALELNPKPPELLERYLDRTGNRSRVHAHYGVDQADRAAVQQIIETDFGGRSIDLVIDDASHMLEPSRVSLDSVLPYVAPGGCYILEDWDWCHTDYSGWGPAQLASLPDGPGLTALVAEMLATLGSRTSVIERVDATRTWAKAWRGTADLDPKTFQLTDHYLTGGPHELRASTRATSEVG